MRACSRVRLQRCWRRLSPERACKPHASGAETMFFMLSKIVWTVLVPGNLLALALAVGAVGLFTRFARAARLLVAAVTAVFLVIGATPLANALLRPLEDRFPRPAMDMAPPTGLIVLGGGVSELTTRARGVVETNEAGDRMIAAVALARKYPEARVVFTGGSAAVFGSALREADVAQRLFLELGLASERLTFERESRNTAENARFTRDLVQPNPGERWLLVTSASHMPRAMGLFRKAGFDVTPYPVDYQTTGLRGDYRSVYLDVSEKLSMTSRALREYVGLAAYRLTGKIDDLFPAP